MRDPATQRVFDAWKTAQPTAAEPTIDDVRDALDGMLANFPPDDHIVRKLLELDGVPASRVTDGDTESDRCVLYLHGGGFIAGSLDGTAGLAGRVAVAAGAEVYAVDYRLAPEHPYPAGLDDAYRAFRALAEQVGDARRIAVVGDSAGGNLALAVALRARDADGQMPGAYVGFSPWLDLTLSGGSIDAKAAVDPLGSANELGQIVSGYLQGAAESSSPEASPLFADLSGLSPMLIQVGSEEILLDDARRLEERARAAGVEVTCEIADGLPHVYQYFASILPEGQLAIDRAGAFIQQHTG